MWAIFAGLTAAFVGSNFLVEFLRRQTDNWLIQPMSAYLTGPYGWIQSLGFLCLSAALILLTYIHVGSFYLWQIPLYVAGIALVGVVVTKWLNINKTGETRNVIEKAHTTCAAFAFGGVTWAELFHPGAITQWDILPRLAIGSAVAFYMMRRTEYALMEKLYTVLVVAWLFSL